MKFVDITGQRFGRLTVIKATESRNGIWYWRCRCDCGQAVTVRGISLRYKNTTSCGCWQREITTLRSTVHGAAKRGGQTPEYATWKRMLNRCYNSRSPDFKDYGGRGIEVCKRWRDFMNFLVDMGLRPAGNYSIERVNVNRDYEPSNCIWLPMREQPKNTRRTRNNRNLQSD